MSKIEGAIESENNKQRIDPQQLNTTNGKSKNESQVERTIQRRNSISSQLNIGEFVSVALFSLPYFFIIIIHYYHRYYNIFCNASFRVEKK